MIHLPELYLALRFHIIYHTQTTMITRIVCIRPKGRTQCIFPRPQHTCLYIYWPKVNLYQAIVVGQQSVRTLFKSLVQLFCKCFLKKLPFWMSKKHFLPFQINTTIFIFVNIFTKWLPAAILDDRNSLLMAFLAISDQYETFFFNFYKIVAGANFGCPKFTFDHIFLKFLTKWLRRPFCISEIHVRSHFWPF